MSMGRRKRDRPLDSSTRKQRCSDEGGGSHAGLPARIVHARTIQAGGAELLVGPEALKRATGDAHAGIVPLPEITGWTDQGLP
jgi:hypothetical protein